MRPNITRKVSKTGTESTLNENATTPRRGWFKAASDVLSIIRMQKMLINMPNINVPESPTNILLFNPNTLWKKNGTNAPAAREAMTAIVPS